MLLYVITERDLHVDGAQRGSSCGEQISWWWWCMHCMRWKCGKVQVHFWNASNSIHFRFVFTAIQTRFKKVIWTFTISTHTVWHDEWNAVCVCTSTDTVFICHFTQKHTCYIKPIPWCCVTVLVVCLCIAVATPHRHQHHFRFVHFWFHFAIIFVQFDCRKTTRPTKTASNNIIQLSFLNACSLPQARKMERLVKTCRLLFFPRVQLRKSYACSLFLYVQVFPQKKQEKKFCLDVEIKCSLMRTYSFHVAHASATNKKTIYKTQER